MSDLVKASFLFLAFAAACGNDGSSSHAKANDSDAGRHSGRSGNAGHTEGGEGGAGTNDGTPDSGHGGDTGGEAGRAATGGTGAGGTGGSGGASGAGGTDEGGAPSGGSAGSGGLAGTGAGAGGFAGASGAGVAGTGGRSGASGSGGNGPAGDYAGVWKGLTEQNKPIEFEIDGVGLLSLSYGWQLPLCSSTTIITTAAPPLIMGNHLHYSQLVPNSMSTDIDIHFESDSTASGVLTFTLRRIGPPSPVPVCTGTETVDFTATKQR